MAFRRRSRRFSRPFSRKRRVDARNFHLCNDQFVIDSEAPNNCTTPAAIMVNVDTGAPAAAMGSTSKGWTFLGGNLAVQHFIRPSELLVTEVNTPMIVSLWEALVKIPFDAPLGAHQFPDQVPAFVPLLSFAGGSTIGQREGYDVLWRRLTLLTHYETTMPVTPSDEQVANIYAATPLWADRGSTHRVKSKRRFDEKSGLFYVMNATVTPFLDTALDADFVIFTNLWLRYAIRHDLTG